MNKVIPQSMSEITLLLNVCGINIYKADMWGHIDLIDVIEYIYILFSILKFDI